MFDIGMFEMILIGVIALLILGPERMPEAARAAGRWVGKTRRFITGVKADVKSQMSLSELEELRQLRNDLASAKTNLSKMQARTADTLNEQVSIEAGADKPAQAKKKPDKKPPVGTKKISDKA